MLTTLMAAASAAVPSSAAAGAANCQPDSPRLAECQQLSTCLTIGAGIFISVSAEEAVARTRQCLALDQRYVLVRNSSGRSDAVERTPPLRAAQSTFRVLYCLAVERAGQSDPQICEVRSTSRRRGGRRGGRAPDRGTREPRFTGRV